MNLKNQQVLHKAFGNGTVIEQSGDYITVQFVNAAKKFVSPDAFMAFLKCEDTTLQSELESEYIKKKEKGHYPKWN